MQPIDRKPDQTPAQGAPAQLSPLAVALYALICDRRRMGASFGLLTFYMEAHRVPWRGSLNLCMTGNKNVIFCKGWSSAAAEALAELHELRLIRLYAMTDPDDPITALEWEKGFPLPLAKQPWSICKKPCFLPARFFAEGYEPTRNAVRIDEGWTCAER